VNVYELKRKALGHHCPQIGGSSKSASTNINEDNRVTAGTVGISGAGNTVQITDGGIVARSLQTVDDTVDAVVGKGFTQLLDLAGSMFDQSQGLIGQTQKAVADAYGQAVNDKNQTIDNRTIIVMALAAAAVLIVMNWKR
jgi:hypothetical protein